MITMIMTITMIIIIRMIIKITMTEITMVMIKQ